MNIPIRTWGKLKASHSLNRPEQIGRENEYERALSVVRVILTAIYVVGVNATVAKRSDQVTLALAPVWVQSRGTLRNVKIVNVSGGDVVDEA